MQRILVACAISVTMMTATVFAEETEPRQVLFTNVNIFNGVDAEIIKGGSVLVEGNRIKKVSAKPITAKGAYTIDGEGRTLMPGLIDMH